MYKAGVDWGSSSFRAYKFSEDGEVMDTCEAPVGLKFVPTKEIGNETIKDYEQTLFDQIGEWLIPGDSVLLSGMITSRTGWLETPYIECPAKLSTLPTQATVRDCRGISLFFLPGLCQRHPWPDVIRGEELQLIGAESSEPSTIVIMPGTHSKWARVDRGTVTRFRTLVTGELYELLLKQSLVGELSIDGTWSHEAFSAGVNVGYQTDAIVSQLFTCRSAVLLEQMQAQDLGAWLSGLLIGNELREGLASMGGANTSLALVGSDVLCQQYLAALSHIGLRVHAIHADASAMGFSQLIKSAERPTSTPTVEG